MCIFLATTAHPDYALIVINNRDEYILRPTSRPHWWSANAQQILSARDLQRAEQGTWLGVTKAGNLAILTNYREDDANDKDHPVQGHKSRGGMVTAWMTAPPEETTQDFVRRTLSGQGVKGVGGFSLVCGKLRKREDPTRLEPLAIISNRAGTADEVPWIAEGRNEVYGLSNTSYDDPEGWPKVKMGKERLSETVDKAAREKLDEDALVDQLYGVLDTDTMPPQGDETFEEYLRQLRNSIFIPSIGKADPISKMPSADQIAAAGPLTTGQAELDSRDLPQAKHNSSMTGIYGTQRQTILLVKWDGTVSFRERALWDDEGRPIPRGQADMKFEFTIDGWNAGSLTNGVH